MRNRFTLAQVLRAVRWTGASLVVAYCGISTFLILNLASRETDQNETLSYIDQDNRTDACRDQLEQDFLGLVGVMILRNQTGEVDQILIDRMTNTVDRLDRVDEICPLPERPEN